MKNSKMIAGMALSGALMLAACGGETTSVDADGDGVITQAEVDDAASSAGIKPGEWENTMEFVDISFDESQVPAEARDFVPAFLESMRGQIKTKRDCVTPEEAASPNADMFSGNEDASCAYDSFEFGGGAMSMSITCNAPGSGSVTITQQGTYTAETYESETQVAMPESEMGAVTISAKSSGRYLGACPK